MGTEMVYSLLLSLTATLILELGFALLCRVRSPRDLLLVVLVNVLTNPAVVLLNRLCLNNNILSPWVVVIILELVAVVAEAACYKLRGEKIPHPLLFSLGANSFSYAIGLMASCLLNR